MPDTPTEPRPPASTDTAAAGRGVAAMPPDLEAVALLSKALADLTSTVAELASDHFALRDQIQAGAEQSRPESGGPAPADLRWWLLDRPTASQVWIWLIDWVGWCIDRFALSEEIPACWPQHPPLVEELTALAAAWHLAYDPRAGADAPLRWLEALARSRARLREWDDATRCRTGEHHERRIDQPWPTAWRDEALDAAEHDLVGRSAPSTTPGDGGEPL